jgi:hypothetical protein
VPFISHRFERGFTLKVSTRRLGLKVLPEGIKGDFELISYPSSNGASKRGADPSFLLLPPSLNAKGRGPGVHPEGLTLKGIGY